MKIGLLMIVVIAVSSSAFLFFSTLDIFPSQKISEQQILDDRKSLEEVVNSNTVCSVYYRTELWEMSENKTYDYKNDPIFQECSWVLELEKITNTTYYPSQEQLKNILEYCNDSKDLVETTGLSYSNDTHYIDTINCQWKELGMMKNEN